MGLSMLAPSAFELYTCLCISTQHGQNNKAQTNCTNGGFLPVIGNVEKLVFLIALMEHVCTHVDTVLILR